MVVAVAVVMVVVVVTLVATQSSAVTVRNALRPEPPPSSLMTGDWSV